MIYVFPNAPFTAATSGFTTGLTGTIGYEIQNAAGSVVVTRTTAGIVEAPAGSGIYTATVTASPSIQGEYLVVWDDASGHYAPEELIVGYSAPAAATSPLYITAAQLKATQSMGSTYADSDIAAAIAAASRTIDNICERRFYPDPDANQIRYYSPGWHDGSLTELDIDDLITLTSLLTSNDGQTFGNTWTLNTDFVLEPLNALADGRPYERIQVMPNGSFVFNGWYPRSVKVTGKFGWSAVPDAIVNATTLIAGQLLTASRSAPLGIMAFDGGAIRIARTNGQAMGLLGPYMRHRIAVG